MKLTMIVEIFPDESKLYESFDSIHSNDLIFDLADKTK